MDENIKNDLPNFDEITADKEGILKTIENDLKEKNSEQEENIGTAIDHLDEDAPIPGQIYTLLSFLDPEKIKNVKIRGVKSRGNFSTIEDAQAYAKKLRNIDPNFDIYILEVGKWGAWNPDPLDPNKVENVNYDNEQLNEIMGQYKENHDRAKMHTTRRKNDKIYTEYANSNNTDISNENKENKGGDIINKKNKKNKNVKKQNLARLNVKELKERMLKKYEERNSNVTEGEKYMKEYYELKDNLEKKTDDDDNSKEDKEFEHNKKISNNLNQIREYIDKNT